LKEKLNSTHTRTHKKRKYRSEGYKCPHPSCEGQPPFKTPQSLGGHVTRVHTTADLDMIIAMKEKMKKRAN